MNKEERAAAEARKDKTHDAYVAKRYGIARGEYATRLAAQGGACAICRKRPRARKLAVDHDHTTGRIRGLLCYVCNTSLGAFEFDSDTAYRAAEYLRHIAFDLSVSRPLVETSGNGKRLPVRIEEQGDLTF